MSGRMGTTEAKARELRPVVEKLLTRAKRPTHANRRYLSGLFSDRVASKLIAEAAGLGTRSGGYTRIIKTGMRRRDSAKMAILELVK